MIEVVPRYEMRFRRAYSCSLTHWCIVLVNIIKQRSDQFAQRFSDFDQMAEKIKQPEKHFFCDIDDFPLDMPMEVIELTSNESYKAKFHPPHSDLLTFYASLPDLFKNIKDMARGMFCIFGSTYICEETFSKMNYVKSSHWARLSDEHLQAQLTVMTSNFHVQYDKILQKKQF